MDAALGSCSEAQGSRATWSGGCFAMVIHRTHPVPAYGAPRAVTGGSRGRRDGPTDPNRVRHDQAGKGVKFNVLSRAFAPLPRSSFLVQKNKGWSWRGLRALLSCATV